MGQDFERPCPNINAPALEIAGYMPTDFLGFFPIRSINPPSHFELLSLRRTQAALSASLCDSENFIPIRAAETFSATPGRCIGGLDF
jgi:hypothetical protein